MKLLAASRGSKTRHSQRTRAAPGDPQSTTHAGVASHWWAVGDALYAAAAQRASSAAEPPPRRGPLPSVAELEAYGALDEAALEDIVSTAEAMIDHRHAVERRLARRDRLSILAIPTVALPVVGVAFWLVTLNKPTTAALVAVVGCGLGVVSSARAFRYGRLLRRPPVGDMWNKDI